MLAFGKLRQEHCHEFESNLGYILKILSQKERVEGGRGKGRKEEKKEKRKY